MSEDTSFSPSDYFDAFVEAQIRQGRYSSASGVMCAGLWLL